jgi:mannose-6-phosphate isomerase-like protein (cupin superfamily)
MKLIDHKTQPREDWRAGVETQMQISALTDSTQLTVFEQWCQPGLGAPTHMHTVEEVLSVIEGEADIWVEGEHAKALAGQSVLIPAGSRHGFRNAGEGILHMRAILAAPIFEASYDDRNEASRRWLPAERT